MEIFLIIAWIILIVASYKAAVFALDRGGVL